jgi:protein-S-isoprenylcysteine O-methyltransferase Ste14
MNTSVENASIRETLTAVSTDGSSFLVRVLNRRVVLNYLSTLSFIGLAYWMISSLSNFHRSFLQGEWNLGMFDINAVVRVQAVYVTLIALYAVILIPYYAAHPWLHSKSFTFVQGVGFALRRMRKSRQRRPSPISDQAVPRLPIGFQLSAATRQAGLALLLKFFFAPLMINWCLIHIANLSASLMQLGDGIETGVSGRMLFDTSLFWAAFQLILFIDTLLFTLGYIVEVPALGNRIRSVDPTFFGWFICLACYPPFNDFTLRFLEWQSSDFPFFTNDFVHISINLALLTSLAIFSWASISLGFKASNLTNRGIVTQGPYAVVRHPAYAAKNLAWWLGALPILGMAFATGSWKTVAYSLVALLGWSAIYVLRALTEERHLLMSNNGYAQYAQQVRWRFIPGIW